MEFRALTLHYPAFGFDRDPGTPVAAANPKTFRVGEHGCKRITGDDRGVLVAGVLTEKPRAFWIPYANVVWAEPVPDEVAAPPSPAPSVAAPAPPPVQPEKRRKSA